MRGDPALSTVAAPDDTPIRWEGMTFRSWSELRLAKAFDDRGLLYLPNARGRVGISPRRETRELDALVNVDGLLVNIEVDGAPLHPPERSADEHRRDRLLLVNGIVVFRYDANEVYTSPDRVAAEVVSLAQRARRMLAGG
jgi:hypothetical protein